MKKNIFLFIGFIFLLSNCSTDDHVTISKVETTTESNQKTANNTVPTPQIVPNQIIIQYKNETFTDEIKEIKRIKYQNRFNFTIEKIDYCSCDEKNIELWTINAENPRGVIEELTKNLAENDDEDDMEGDYQFSFQIINDGISGVHSSTIADKTVSQNSPEAVNIVILDTGIDYDYQPNPFLYNSSTDDDCKNEISGWDFVNNDNDPRDDNGHGSFVAQIIINELNQYEIPHHLMAVKAFDRHGRGKYFTVACAFKFIAKKPGKFIVNTSFGYYGLKNQNILQNIIDKVDDRILFVSSAGNEGVNTDANGNEHFPSSYNSSNILTVGGYTHIDGVMPSIDDRGQIRGLVKAPDSNYGSASIDIVAPFYDYQLSLGTRDHIINVIVEGTSFASAFTAARAAYYFDTNIGNPMGIKQDVISSGYSSRSLINFTLNKRILVKNMINPNNYSPTPHIGLQPL